MLRLRNAVRAVVRDDRAESTIMMLVTQNLAALLMVPITAVLVLILTGTQAVMTEGNQQTAMKLAQTTFTADVAQSTAIWPVSSTEVRIASDRSAASISDADFTASPGAATKCRVVDWALVRDGGDRLVLARHLTVTDADSCDDVKNAPDSQIGMPAIPGANLLGQRTLPANTTVVAVDAQTTSAFAYQNVAQRVLTYANGVEGWNGQRVDGQYPGKKRFYTDTEWASEAPKRVQLVLNARMPLSGLTHATFAGETSAHLTGTCSTPQQLKPFLDAAGVPTDTTTATPNPNYDASCKVADSTPVETKIHIPDVPANIVVKRSDTVGAQPGGTAKHEGIDVSWDPTNPNDCTAADEVHYLVRASTITGTGQSSITSAEVTAASVSLPQIWNGDGYTVAVIARCVNRTSGASDGWSDPGRTNFNQTLPAPLLHLAFGAAESTTISTWQRPSSDPRVTYDLGYGAWGANSSAQWSLQPSSGATYWLPAGGSYAAVSPGPGTALTLTRDGLTVAAGFPDAWRIRATLASATPSDWNYASIVYSLPSQQPAATATAQGPGGRVTASPASCPAGTSPRYHFQTDRGDTVAGSGFAALDPASLPADSTAAGGWVASPTYLDRSMDQGTILYGRVLVACSTPFVPLPNIPAAWDRSTPRPLTVAVAGRSDAIQNGWYSGWDSYLRPVQAPAAPANPRTDPTGYGAGQSSTDAWEPSKCGTDNLVIRYRQEYTNLNGPAWSGPVNDPLTVTSVTNVHSEASGSAYGWRVNATCATRLPAGEDQTEQRATSGWASTSFYTAIRNPNIDISRTLPSTLVGNNYSVSVTASRCEAYGDRTAYSGMQPGTSTGTIYKTTAGTYNYATTAYCINDTTGQRSPSDSVATSVAIILPAPEVAVTRSDSSVLAGDSYTITATASCQATDNDVMTVQWTNVPGPDGAVSTAKRVSTITYTVSHTTAATYTYGGTARCDTATDSSATASDSTPVTVTLPAPTVVMTSSDSNNRVWVDDSWTVTARATCAAPASHVYWTNVPGPNDSANTSTRDSSKSYTQSQGNHGDYTNGATARCDTATDSSGTASDSITTTVILPTAPSITIGRTAASTPVGTSESVTGSASCDHGTVHWLNDPRGSYTYNSAGTRSWTGTAECWSSTHDDGPNASDSTSISWYTPAPSTPGDGSGLTYRTPGSATGNGNIGYTDFNFDWSGSSYANGYQASVTINYSDGSTDVFSYDGGATYFGKGACTGVTVSSVSGRVRAYGDGGYSDWRSFSGRVSGATNLPC